MVDAARHSAVYTGWVTHRRFDNGAHTFKYQHNLLYLDLEEIEPIFRRPWFSSFEGNNFASFHRKDYLHPEDRPLRQAVNEQVKAHTGRAIEGPVRMLTSPRLFGLCFNPVTFYYCFDAADQRLEFIVAEINNTPWDERHCYVLQAKEGDCKNVVRAEFDKRFHVSPFHPMDHHYSWRFTRPDAQLRVHMDNHQADLKKFDATLVMERQALTEASLKHYIFNAWPTSYKTLGAIYFQALRLWIKGATFYNHPKQRSHP